MPDKNIPEQKQDVFDPSRFAYIGASETDDIFIEKGPEVFSKTERILSAILHGLTAVSGLLVAILGAVYATMFEYRLEDWGIPGVFGIVLFGIGIAFLAVVSFLHHEALTKGKKGKILPILNFAGYAFCFATFFTAFALLCIRPSVINQYLMSANVFPYSSTSAFILIGIAWAFAIFGTIFQAICTNDIVKETVQDVLLALVLYVPFAFYPILTKTYSLSSINDARPLLVIAPIVMDLGVVFKLLGRSKKGFHTGFHLCAFFAILMEASCLVAYAIANIKVTTI